MGGGLCWGWRIQAWQGLLQAVAQTARIRVDLDRACAFSSLRRGRQSSIPRVILDRGRCCLSLGLTKGPAPPWLGLLLTQRSGGRCRWRLLAVRTPAARSIDRSCIIGVRLDVACGRIVVEHHRRHCGHRRGGPGVSRRAPRPSQRVLLRAWPWRLRDWAGFSACEPWMTFLVQEWPDTSFILARKQAMCAPQPSMTRRSPMRTSAGCCAVLLPRSERQLGWARPGLRLQVRQGVDPDDAALGKGLVGSRFEFAGSWRAARIRRRSSALRWHERRRGLPVRR